MCLYVRDVGIAEGRRLQRMVRRDPNRIKMRRAQVILASDQGSNVPDIAQRFYFSEAHVRTIIKSFNGEGFSALEPKYGIGRPRKFTEEQRSLIIETALVVLRRIANVTEDSGAYSAGLPEGGLISALESVIDRLRKSTDSVPVKRGKRTYQTIASPDVSRLVW